MSACQQQRTAFGPHATTVRTLWLSDLHIGTAEFAHDRLCRFLITQAPNKLFLVGDIFDIRRLRRTGRWNAQQWKAVEILLRTAINCETAYLWGNHDPEIRHLGPNPHPNVSVAREAHHHLADGRHLLMLHGDQVDADIRRDIRRGTIGRATRMYYRLLGIDQLLRRLFSFRVEAPPSILASLKKRHPRWRRYVARFEAAISEIASAARADVVLTGHIHVPKMRRVGSVLYVNCGDWVENCTAVRELADGRLQLVRWDGKILDECRRHAL